MAKSDNREIPDNQQIPVNKVNLNQAGKEELSKVNGIGEDTADAILRYRKENGDFTNLEELRNINGMEHNRFESIRDRLSL